MTEFFMAMVPPTVTHQMHRVSVVNGKPKFYDSPALSNARQKLTANLFQHRPKAMYTTGVRLVTKWIFPKGKHKNGSYRTTRPDTDNLQKLLKDCMTDCRFWKDDALVASEICEKFWGEPCGIYVRVEEL